MLTRFLYQKLECETALGSSVGTLKEQPLSKIGSMCEGRKVISLKSNELALMGFRKLLQLKSFKDWQLAALPIVDSKNGKLVGNLSESDLRGINRQNLLDLLLPASEYLKKIHGGKIPKPITVTTNTRYVDALQTVVKKKIHRAWIVDSNG